MVSCDLKGWGVWGGRGGGYEEVVVDIGNKVRPQKVVKGWGCVGREGGREGGGSVSGHWNEVRPQ